MTNYTPYGVTLTEGQIQKIKSAHDNDREITIRISKKNLSGNMNIPLTQTQINKIKKSKSGVDLCLSKAQLKHMNKNGGFLPLLAALIPAALGAVGGLAGGISSAVNSSKQTSEMARHNRAIEDIAKGSGMLSDAAAPIPIAGKILSNALKKLGLGGCVKNLKGAAWGTGLYLQREGSGVFKKPQGE
jgi:hypothetical protein